MKDLCGFAIRVRVDCACDVFSGVAYELPRELSLMCVLKPGVKVRLKGKKRFKGTCNLFRTRLSRV